MGEEGKPEYLHLADHDHGSVAAGCGIGCLVQIFCGGVPLLLVQLFPNNQQRLTMIAMLFGITQLLVLVPLVWKMKPGPRTHTGMVITAAVGFTLSSACGWTIVENELGKMRLPGVVESYPDYRQTGVSTDLQIRLKFNKPVLPPKPGDVRSGQGAVNVPITVDLREGNTVLFITPRAALQPNTYYFVLGCRDKRP